MKARRIWRRLGVSTVIANLMMISITMALAAILVAWAGTSYGAFSGGTQLFYQQRGQALQERFVIENVFFNTGPPKTILLYVRSVGLLDINIAAIYNNGNPIATPFAPSVTCTLSTTTKTYTTFPVVGPVGSVCQFTLTYTWTDGMTYTFVVASARGNQATYIARAPCITTC